jgi:hypothetical protein
MGRSNNPESSFDEFGDHKHWVIVHNLAYFQCQDGELLDDVIDQCVFDAQTSQRHHDPDNPTFYDECKTEPSLPPEDSLPEPTSSEPKIMLAKRAPDSDKLRPFFGLIAADLIK